ncbi:MAG: FkbM family methyltransferase [Verrucomicrobia bacterium]|nr:FkbM family methyltransferase [Verrucomicrobiota bacterium]
MNLRDKMSGIRALWHFDNRWQLILNRLLFPQIGLTVYKKGTVEILVDHNSGDHNGTRLCLVSDIYTRFLPAMTEIGDTLAVLDLGANGGGFPLLLHLSGKSFSKLVCVEMNPNTFRRLHYNITRNIPSDLQLIQAAVCGESRTLELALGDGDISDSIYQNKGAPSPSRNQRYRIDGVTLDSIILREFGKKTIDICKMDIEGAEYEVLGSPTSTYLNQCRYLLIELHRSTTEKLQRLENILDETGFQKIAPRDGGLPSERLYLNSALK